MDDKKNRSPRRSEQPSYLMQLLRLTKSYLHLLIMIAAVLLIIIFLIGSITRAVQHKIYNDRISNVGDSSNQGSQGEMQTEAAQLLEKAADLARHFDYSGAIAVLDSFTGDMQIYPELAQKHQEYCTAQDNMVLWSDPDSIVNLSFQTLIADPQRAFSDSDYGTSFNRNYVTTGEFNAILQQLYSNGYILVNMSDFTGSNGAKELYLPYGKKPLVLTQTSVNYYTFMVDGDGDSIPDADGSGFASKLVFDEHHNITCEMVDGTGNTVYGAFDMIPILDAFVETHPDFSYKGAKAVIAVTGYDGLFGYRTNPEAEALLGIDQYAQEIAGAAQIAQALRETGYELACYSYGNEPYGDLTAEQITEEMNRWKNEVHPILGFTNIFVYSKNSDIAQPNKDYSDAKFDVLYAAGFRYFSGFCQDSQPWFSSHGKYVRQGRILVTGANMANSPALFNGLFTPSAVLDPSRSS